MAYLRAALVLASAVSSLVIPTQPILTRYAAGKVLEAAELKAKDKDWPVTICVCDGGGAPAAAAALPPAGGGGGGALADGVFRPGGGRRRGGQPPR